MKLSTAYFISFAIILLLGGGVPALAQQQMPQPLGELSKAKQQEVEDLFHNMEQMRRKLISGQYRATGYMRWRGVGEEKFIEGPVQRFCAFDHSAGKLHYECTQPSRDHTNEEPDKNGYIEYSEIVRTTQYIETPEKVILGQPSYWEGHSGTVTIYAGGEKRHPDVNPVVIEALGLVTFIYMIGIEREDTWSNMRTFSNTEFEIEDNQVKLTKSFIAPGGSHELKREYTIDVSNGITPLLFEEWDRRKESADWGKPISRAEITWEQIGEVWVPSTLFLESFGLGHTFVDELRLSFDWAFVNEPVDESLFKRESLEMGRGTHVFDQQLGERILLEIVGRDELQERKNMQKQPERQGANMKRWLILLNVLAVVVIGVVAFLRGRSSG